MVLKETLNIFRKILNRLLVIMTVISFFLLDVIRHPIVWLFGFIFILLVILLVIYFFLQRKTQKIIKTGNVKIIIEQGDIFDEKGLKVIPVDEELTLQVDNIKVSEKSLHGKFLKQYNIKKKNLKSIDGLYIW